MQVLFPATTGNHDALNAKQHTAYVHSREDEHESATGTTRRDADLPSISAERNEGPKDVRRANGFIFPRLSAEVRRANNEVVEMSENIGWTKV